MSHVFVQMMIERKHVPTILMTVFLLSTFPSPGWCWDPTKSVREIISGEKSIDEQLKQQFEPVSPHYETNKFNLKAEQEAGGWILAWSDDISETDAINGAVAAGVSIYSGGTAFALWIQNLVQRTIGSTMRSAETRFPDYIERDAESLAQQVIFDAIQSKSSRNALRNYDTVDFKAGAIRYTGGNYLGNQLVGPHTWGMKIYLGFRVR